MPDQSTGANALMAGEIDYMQYLPFDMLPLLEKERSVKMVGWAASTSSRVTSA